METMARNREPKEDGSILSNITRLEEELLRYQLKGDELEKQNKDLTSQHSALVSHQEQLTAPLKLSEAALNKKIDKLVEQLEKLLEQLENQQQLAQREKEVLSLQHYHKKQKLQEQLEKLNSQHMIRGAKIVEDEEQLIQLKQELESLKKNWDHLTKLMKEAQLDFHNKIEAIEGATFIESIPSVDHLVMKNIQHILPESRAEYTLFESIMKTLQREIKFLHAKADALAESGTDMLNTLANLETHTERVNQDSIPIEKGVKQTLYNCKQLNVSFSITHQQMQAVIEVLTQWLDLMSQSLCEIKDEVNELVAKIETEKSRRKQLDGLTQEAVLILKHILMDSEKSTDTQWMLERLLEILESGAKPPSSTLLKESSRTATTDLHPQTSKLKRCQMTSDLVDLSDLNPLLLVLQAEASTSAEQ